MGLIFQTNGKWDSYITRLIDKVNPIINYFRTLKYRLNRKSLETIYKSFILPHFDYCDVIWDNLSNSLSDRLENLQLDCIRTITGCVRGTSHAKLYRESGFITLRERRRRHKLHIFYKMVNNLTPTYLSALLPNRISQTQPYNLRHKDNIRPITCRTNSYAESFVPSSITLWNELPCTVRDLPTLSSFKAALSANDISIPLPYLIGNRKTQIIHCRIRLGNSDLNGDRFLRHIQSDPLCECGHQYEDAYHFILICPRYRHIREHEYFYTNRINIVYILNGIHQNNAETKRIFESLHNYIEKSNRFST